LSRRAGPKTRILVPNDVQLEVDVLEILSRVDRPMSGAEILEDLARLGYLAYDPEEAEKDEA